MKEGGRDSCRGGMEVFFHGIGGVVTIAVDRAALDVASTSDPDLTTVDSFVERMVEADMFENVADGCTLEVSLTDTSNLQMALVSAAMDNAEFCNNKSKVRVTSSLVPRLAIVCGQEPGNEARVASYPDPPPSLI